MYYSIVAHQYGWELQILKRRKHCIFDASRFACVVQSVQIEAIISHIAFLHDNLRIW